MENLIRAAKGLFQPGRPARKSLRKKIFRFALLLEFVALFLVIGWNLHGPLMRTAYADAGSPANLRYAPGTIDPSIPTATDTLAPSDTPLPTVTNTPQPSNTPVATAANTGVPADTKRAVVSKTSTATTKTKTSSSTSTGGTLPNPLPSPTKEPTNTKTKKPTKSALGLDATGSVLAATAAFGSPPNTNPDKLVLAPLAAILRHISPETILIGVMIIVIIIVGGIIYYSRKDRP